MAVTGVVEGSKLGIRVNLKQFLWLAVSTLLTGMTVGLERAVVPLLGKQVYHVNGPVLLLAFIVSFGVAKSVLNLVAGHWSDLAGRRPVLVAGWLAGIPMMLLLLLVHDWTAVLAANVFLGVNQALTWTMSVTQQLDLARPTERGFAMGVNEAVGYLGVAFSTVLSGWVASRYGLVQAPFVLGLAVICAGLSTALFAVRETRGHVRAESRQRGEKEGQREHRKGVFHTFWTTTVSDPTLSALSQGGLANKLADTLVWGLVPVYLARNGLSVLQVGWIAGVYALVWGLAQFGTGLLSDFVGRKPPILAGFLLLGAGILAFAAGRGPVLWTATAAVMGFGMALLYPNLNSAVADVAHPEVRGATLGVYRLWRDGGYAIGGLLLGASAVRLGLRATLFVTGILVLLSMTVILLRMKETRRGPDALPAEPGPGV